MFPCLLIAAFHHVVDGASGPLWDGHRGHQHAVVQELHRAAAAGLPHGNTRTRTHAHTHTGCACPGDLWSPRLRSTTWPSSSTWEPWRTCCSPPSWTFTSWPCTSSSVPCSSETHTHTHTHTLARVIGWNVQTYTLITTSSCIKKILILVLLFVFFRRVFGDIRLVWGLFKK